MEKEIQIKQLNQEIDLGLSQLARGEGIAGEKVFDEIQALSKSKRHTHK